jgi:hypothetical protein
VHVTTAVTGVSAPGTAYRMDEIPMTLRPGLKSPYPTDEQVINLLLAAVAKKPAWRPAAPEEWRGASHGTPPFRRGGDPARGLASRT